MTIGRFRRISALAVALLSAASWANDAPRALDLKRATVVLQDDKVVEVAGGYWLSDEAGKERAKELVDLRAQNKALRESAGDIPAKVVVAALVIGACVGLAGGMALGLAARR